MRVTLRVHSYSVDVEEFHLLPPIFSKKWVFTFPIMYFKLAEIPTKLLSFSVLRPNSHFQSAGSEGPHMKILDCLSPVVWFQTLNKFFQKQENNWKVKMIKADLNKASWFFWARMTFDQNLLTDGVLRFLYLFAHYEECKINPQQLLKLPPLQQ